MSNTLTNLVPILYQALDTVSRELTGFIPSVTRDSGVERAALNQSVRSIVAPAATVSDVTPASTVPDDGDQTIGNVEVTISKSRRAPFRWTGEEEVGVNHAPGAGTIQSAQIEQAMRAIVNEIEADIASLYVAASRATGTAGTTPFATTLADTAALRKILSNNGSPLSDLHLVINTDAGTALRTLTQLTNANQAGGDATLRQGELLSLHGFGVQESAQVKSHTKGTGTSYTTTNAGFAIGTTSIPIITGSGTVLAGDTVTFAGDSNKYIVTTGVTEPGTIVIAAPGLRQAIPGSATAMTIGANSVNNLAFARSAIVLATRLPALPSGGDLASDRLAISDARTGLAFEVAMYPGYRQMHYEVSAAWGYKMVKPEHAAILLG